MVNPRETGLNSEFSTKECEITPATGENSKFFRNCVIIKPGATIEKIAELAVKHGAFVDNSGEEAGDDRYLVQFPGHNQEDLNYDGLLARLRELNGEEGGE